MQNEWIVPKKARLNAVCTPGRKFSSSRACRVRCCISSAARFVKVTTTRHGRISAAFGERAIDKTRCVIAVVLPEPADATTEKLRSSSLAKRARTDSSRGFTMFPTPLSQGRARDASAPMYLPKCRCRCATSPADRTRCNQRPDGSHLSFRKSPCAAFSRDRQRRRDAVQDRQRIIVARRFLPRARECSHSLRRHRARARLARKDKAATLLL